jgi:hypothetical protein
MSDQIEIARLECERARLARGLEAADSAANTALGILLNEGDAAFAARLAGAMARKCERALEEARL